MIDLLFLIGLIFYGFKGYNKGIIITLILGVATIIGIVAAVTLSSAVSKIFLEHINENIFLLRLIPILSYAFVYFGMVFIMKLAGRTLKQMTKSIGLGIMDKLFGALLAIGIFIGVYALINWVLVQLGIWSTDSQSSSVTLPFLLSLAGVLLDTFQLIFPFLKNGIVELQLYFKKLQVLLDSYVAIN